MYFVFRCIQYSYLVYEGVHIPISNLIYCNKEFVFSYLFLFNLYYIEGWCKYYGK